MKTVHIHRIDEKRVKGKRLGRHVEHDTESRAYTIRHDDVSDKTLKSVDWECHADILDQGEIGACTGFAEGELLSTGQFYQGKAYTAADCIALYELATKLDNIPGEYPPDDTGSSGLAVCKAAKELKLISAYHHAFTIRAALKALQSGPVITGINWYDSFDTPNSSGFVAISTDAIVRGGHEVMVWGLHVELMESGIIDEIRSFIKIRQSWGKEFGDGGNFYMTLATWHRLLTEKGDITVPLPLPPKTLPATGEGDTYAETTS